MYIGRVDRGRGYGEREGGGRGVKGRGTGREERGGGKGGGDDRNYLEKNITKK